MFTGVTYRTVDKAQLHHREAPSQSRIFASSSGSWSLRTLHEGMVMTPSPQGLVQVITAALPPAAEQLAKCQVPGGPSLFHLSCNSTRPTISLHFERTEAPYPSHFWVLKISVSWGTLVTVTESPNPCNPAQVIPFSPTVQAALKQLPRNQIHFSSGALIFSLWPLRTQRQGN